MKQHFLFAVLMGLLASGFGVYQALFPPPPADYRIVYLGSPNCGACIYWKKSILPVWRRDSAVSTVRLELATLRGNPYQAGYGAHDSVFHDALKRRRSISWPSFVLYNHGALDGVYIGIEGWERLAKKVRKEAARSHAVAARKS